MKKNNSRRFGLVSASVLALVLTACSSGTDSASEAPADSAELSGQIGFLMPDLASTRYEEQDAPLFKAKVAELCPACEVIYQNADADPAKQQQQAEALIAQGINVLVLDAVDTKAAASIVVAAKTAGIPVVTYDRPISTEPADYYVSFDNELIGKAIAESLVAKLKADNASGGILIVGGSPTDQAAGLIKKGMEAGVAGSGFDVLAQFDTPEWDPAKAQEWVSGQITQFKNKIVGVVAANDGTGGGSIAAFKAAGVNPVPPVTGNDAEIAAIQRIIAGEQYNTISKPISIVAGAAAEIAIAFLKGTPPAGETTLYDTPSQLFTPEVVTIENVKAIIFDGGIYTADQVCTADYKAACTAAGIM